MNEAERRQKKKYIGERRRTSKKTKTMTTRTKIKAKTEMTEKKCDSNRSKNIPE